MDIRFDFLPFGFQQRNGGVAARRQHLPVNLAERRRGAPRHHRVDVVNAVAENDVEHLGVVVALHRLQLERGLVVGVVDRLERRVLAVIAEQLEQIAGRFHVFNVGRGDGQHTAVAAVDGVVVSVLRFAEFRVREYAEGDDLVLCVLKNGNRGGVGRIEERISFLKSGVDDVPAVLRIALDQHRRGAVGKEIVHPVKGRQICVLAERNCNAAVRRPLGGYAITVTHDRY